jgi:hypothetical protein
MGAIPGYFWSAPTYVTELVGYLYRRNTRPIVCVYFLFFFGGLPILDTRQTRAVWASGYNRIE